MAAAARELVRREHDLERVAELYVAALEQAAGGAAVADAVLGEVAARGRGRRDRARLAPRRASSRARLAEVELGAIAARAPSRPGRWLGGIVVALVRVPRPGSGAGWSRPFIMVDELDLLASSRGASPTTGELRRARRADDAATALIYPLLIAPAYALFDSLPDAYAAVKAINALVMSLAAIPAYLLARRVLPAARRCSRRCSRSRSRRWSTPAR